ncbi:MAG: hypothetical protein FWF51_10145 [Chitinivibrionia bacterium]|nr:hypothetical protein [Chitinivibrionia bacterium]MCL1947489.1 hypothetical protein [Chitinivibrionia bacterium]
MKNKVLILSLLFAFIPVYPIVDIVPLSPYVNRGCSFDFNLSYNPTIITHYYEQKPQEYKYSVYANVIYFIRNDWEPEFWSFNLGFPNEKFEMSFLLRTFTRIPVSKFRIKIKLFEKGEDRIFRNIALSSFIGVSEKTYSDGTGLLINNSREVGISSVGNSIYYGGISLGTRKKIDEFSYFEVFANPYFSLIKYRGLGNKSYDPAKILGNLYASEENLSLQIPYIIVPVSVGFKYKQLELKTGVAISTPIGGETKNLDREGTFLDKVVVDSYNFPQIPFFAEISFITKSRKADKKSDKKSKNNKNI